MPLVVMARPNGPRVRELRDGLGWSQGQLGRRIGRTRQAVSKVELCKPVSETLMRQIASALNTDLAEITLPDEGCQKEPAEPDGVAA